MWTTPNTEFPPKAHICVSYHKALLIAFPDVTNILHTTRLQYKEIGTVHTSCVLL